jgi:sarcosine oxidase subunit gamma
MADGVTRIPVAVRETEWLRLLAGDARLEFRGDAQARLAVGTAFGIPLATVTGRAVTHRARAALSLGPDEHLLIMPERDAPAFVAELASTLDGRPHSLVDVSHRQVALDLRGAHGEWLLAAACPLPLDPAALPVDACTRTIFAKAGIVLWRTAADALRVEVARSYCRYVVDLLGEIARELPASPRDAGGVS